MSRKPKVIVVRKGDRAGEVRNIGFDASKNQPDPSAGVMSAEEKHHRHGKHKEQGRHKESRNANFRAGTGA